MKGFVWALDVTQRRAVNLFSGLVLEVVVEEAVTEAANDMSYSLQVYPITDRSKRITLSPAYTTEGEAADDLLRLIGSR